MESFKQLEDTVQRPFLPDATAKTFAEGASRPAADQQIEDQQDEEHDLPHAGRVAIQPRRKRRSSSNHCTGQSLLHQIGEISFCLRFLGTGPLSMRLSGLGCGPMHGPA